MINNINLNLSVSNIDGSITRPLNKAVNSTDVVQYKKYPYFKNQVYDDDTNRYSYEVIKDTSGNEILQNMNHCFDLRLVNESSYNINLDTNYEDAVTNYFKVKSLPTENVLNLFNEANEPLSKLEIYSKDNASSNIQLCFAVSFKRYLNSAVPLNLVSNQTIKFGMLIIE